MKKINYRLLGVQFNFLQFRCPLFFSYQMLSTFRDVPLLFQKAVLSYDYMVSPPSPEYS